MGGLLTRKSRTLTPETRNQKTPMPVAATTIPERDTKQFFVSFACFEGSLKILLISEAVELTAVRAVPGYAVAGHAPHVFQHAVITDLESASATPAKRQLCVAAVALV